MKVVATAASSKLGVKVKELGRIARPGEEFEVSQARFKILNGGNRYRSIFAVPVPNVPKQTKEVKVESFSDGSIVEQADILNEPVKPVEMPEPAEPKVKIEAKKVTVDAKKVKEKVKEEPVVEEVKPEKKKRTRKTTKKKVVENE